MTLRVFIKKKKVCIYKIYIHIHIYICCSFSELISAKLEWCVEGCVPSPLFVLHLPEI